MGCLINTMLAIETMFEESQWFRTDTLCNCFLNVFLLLSDAQAITLGFCVRRVSSVFLPL